MSWYQNVLIIGGGGTSSPLAPIGSYTARIGWGVNNKTCAAGQFIYPGLDDSVIGAGNGWLFVTTESSGSHGVTPTPTDPSQWALRLAPGSYVLNISVTTTVATIGKCFEVYAFANTSGGTFYRFVEAQNQSIGQYNTAQAILPLDVTEDFVDIEVYFWIANLSDTSITLGGCIIQIDRLS